MKQAFFLIMCIGFGSYATVLMLADKPTSGYTMAVAVMMYVLALEEELKEKGNNK